MADIVFFVSALVCLISAICIVSRKNPVYSVVFMLPFFLGMTMIFVLLQATFLAAIQMIVYGGAILVVFLFVIMLINLRPEELRDDFEFGRHLIIVFCASVFGATILLIISEGVTPGQERAFREKIYPEKIESRSAAGDPVMIADPLKIKDKEPIFGSIERIAKPLFEQQMVPFELASILIVVALLGAVLLSKKRV